MQKKNSLFSKFLYFINSIFALLLLLAYVILYVEPEKLGSFAGISLITPLLILINCAFMIYWILRIKRKFLLSFIILAIGFPNLPRFYKVSGKKIILTDDIKVMSYNVRMFNKYEWIEADSIPDKINHLIDQKSADIICIQEYTHNETIEKSYPHNFIKYSENNKHFGHAIFSKYPIVKEGSLDFEKTANNIIYADIKINTDTIRVYNIHLQSLKINPNKENFGEKDVSKLRKRISNAFQVQQHQVEKFLVHQQSTTHPIVIAGDFNNTAYSWPYRNILKGKKDAFVAAGKGFDKTFDFVFPIRIDFVMVDKGIKVNHFKTYRNKFSDHYPILARLERKSLLKSEKE